LAELCAITRMGAVLCTTQSTIRMLSGCDDDLKQLFVTVFLLIEHPNNSNTLFIQKYNYFFEHVILII